jgi:hypothetical protein
MAQPVLLRLSPAEWMLCVMTVQPDAAPTLAETLNRSMTPERLQGALQAARDALLARDLARLNGDGRLDINPVVRMCARAVLTPRASFGLTVIEGNGSSRVVFYNWLPGFAIGTWVDANQIRSFELLDSEDLIATQLLAQWHGDANVGANTSAAPSGPVEAKSYTMTASTLPALPVDKPEKVAGLATALARGGLPAEEAAALDRAFAMPNRRAVLAGANPTTPTRTLLWLGDVGKMWLVAQATGAANITITSTNTNGLTREVTAFVRELLSSAGKG